MCSCMCSNVETNLSWTCLVSGLLNFEHPSVLLFCIELFHEAKSIPLAIPMTIKKRRYIRFSMNFCATPLLICDVSQTKLWLSKGYVSKIKSFSKRDIFSLLDMKKSYFSNLEEIRHIKHLFRKFTYYIRVVVYPIFVLRDPDPYLRCFTKILGRRKDI